MTTGQSSAMTGTPVSKQAAWPNGTNECCANFSFA
jgi:hypothetical protein